MSSQRRRKGRGPVRGAGLVSFLDEEAGGIKIGPKTLVVGIVMFIVFITYLLLTSV
ncbi:MAG: preprotein translocase subunit Sec61beta [Candidatus Korarchaeota archaeon]